MSTNTVCPHPAITKCPQIQFVHRLPPHSVRKPQFVHKILCHSVHRTHFVHTKHQNMSTNHTLSTENHHRVSTESTLSTENHHKVSTKHNLFITNMFFLLLSTLQSYSFSPWVYFFLKGGTIVANILCFDGCEMWMEKVIHLAMFTLNSINTVISTDFPAIVLCDLLYGHFVT